jgi:Glycosyltransferase family 87
LFALLVMCLGGFSGSDTFESVFSTWAVAHGQLACAFPHGFRVTAPLYPLLSGGVAAFSHVGHGAPFPLRSTMGPHCDNAFVAINTWSLSTKAITSTVKIGYLGWFALMAGIVVLLRTTERGRTRWEPVVALLVACTPMVWTCVQSTFHPEDLLALGLALGALACARRGSWAAAGVLIGLGFLSQQFALLVAVPLLVLAPPLRRASYAWAASLTLAVVAVPLIIMSSGSAAQSVLFGTGTTGGIGGSALSELHLHGVSLLLLSRVAPVVLAGLITWVAKRRLGARVLEPVALLSLVALSLGLRLVFEQQIFEYYFMALAVSLILLDVTRGRIRGALVAWLLLVPIVFLGEIQGLGDLDHPLRAAVILLAVGVVVAQALRGIPRRDLAPWIGLAAVSVVGWSTSPLLYHLPTWFWQVVLVSSGIALAAAPLLTEFRCLEATDRARARPRATVARPAAVLPLAPNGTGAGGRGPTAPTKPPRYIGVG